MPAILIAGQTPKLSGWMFGQVWQEIPLWMIPRGELEEPASGMVSGNPRQPGSWRDTAKAGWRMSLWKVDLWVRFQKGGGWNWVGVVCGGGIERTPA